MVTALSSFVPALSATATGASLIAVTVIVPALATEFVPSPTLYDNATLPLKSAPGENAQVPSPLSVIVPLSTVTPLTLSVSPSISLALDRKSAWVINRAPSSATLKLTGDVMSTTGASFTAVTLTDTVCVAVPPLPSEAV